MGKAKGQEEPNKLANSEQQNELKKQAVNTVRAEDFALTAYDLPPNVQRQVLKAGKLFYKGIEGEGPSF